MRKKSYKVDISMETYVKLRYTAPIVTALVSLVDDTLKRMDKNTDSGVILREVLKGVCTFEEAEAHINMFSSAATTMLCMLSKAVAKIHMEANGEDKDGKGEPSPKTMLTSE